MGSPRDKEVDCVTTDSKGGSEGDGEALAAGVSRVARPPGRASSSAATQPSALDAAAVPGWSAQGLREPAQASARTRGCSDVSPSWAAPAPQPWPQTAWRCQADREVL